ncbi:MAG: hypothetical protein U0835_04010, partial [Isosphaeraceae bacterium]
MRTALLKAAPLFASAAVMLGASAVTAQREAGPVEGAVSGPVKTETVRALDPEETTVRLMLGLGDPAPRVWSGRVKVDQGEVVGVDGGRFHAGDRVSGRDAWEARSVLVRKVAAKKAAAKKKANANAAAKPSGGPGTDGPGVAPNLITVRLKAPRDATLEVTTDQGEFRVPLADLAGGAPVLRLNNRVAVQRVPAWAPLVDGEGQDDFPAAASDGLGGAWVVYVEHRPKGPDALAAYTARPKDFSGLKPAGGGDQVKLVHITDGKAETPIDVTGPGLDVWRPSVVHGGFNMVSVVWSENREGDFELYSKGYNPMTRALSAEFRVTNHPGTDCDAVLASTSSGPAWVAWQQWTDGRARVMVKPLTDPGPGQPAGDGVGNEWSPSIAVDGRGNPWVAFDSYAKGNYDVNLRRFTKDGQPDGPLVAVAESPRYEAHASVAVDPKGRAWVAYEERTENWGKDAENLVTGSGTTLYRSSAVRVRCVDGGKVLDAPDPLAATPTNAPLRVMNSFPRLHCDARGRVWLAFRHRQEAIWGNNAVMVVGGVWLEYVSALAGEGWSYAVPVPASDNLLDNRPALVDRGEKSPLLVYSSDGR